MQPQVVVVGAGVSGVACARALHDAGVAVRVLDRGRVPGGRAASRTLHGRRVDLGASYLTVRDPAFAAVVDDWASRGLARPWTDVFDVAGPDGWRPSSTGPLRYGTPHGIRTLVEDLAAPLDVRTGVDVGLVGPGPTVDGERWDAVVLAMPDPQALDLLDPALAEEVEAVEDREWEPVLALAAGFAARTWDGRGGPDSGLTGPFHGAFVAPDTAAGAVLGWVADDGRRRGDDAPVLVAHSTAQAAAPHLDDPQAAAPELVAALRGLLDLPEPDWTYLQRWSLSRPAEPRALPFHLGEAGVGLCGDGWGASRFETAWTSGTALGRALVVRLGAT